MYRSPGVYNKEIDESLYVAGAATSVTGMVGVAEKGPIGEPVLVTNWPQFVETFGGFLAEGYLAYAAKGFFDNGGSVLYVVRTAHYDGGTLAAESASIDVMQTGDTNVAFAVTALTPGAWANGLSVDVATGSGSRFSVEVKDADGAVLERFRNLQDTDASSDDYLETAVNGSSRYVTVTVEDGSPAAGSTTLAGGSDGLDSLADTDFIGDAAAKTGLYALDDVETLKMVAIPGEETPAIHAALGDYAANRGTVFAVLGTPEGLGPTDAIDYREGTGGGNSEAALNAPYASLYWPWIRVSDPRTGRVSTVPVEGHVLGMIARSDAEGEVWYAPAGPNRGGLRGALGVEYVTTQGERDEAYDAGVNVIASFQADGVVVWGQKVLTGKPSALDRVNVRRLLNTIKESLKDTSRYLLFEPNDQRTWRAFSRFATPFLQTIKDGRGLYDFRVVCDETTNTPYYIDNNQMVAKIFVKPTKAAEFIELNYIVTGSGANFDEL